jgi:hypothetical protein
MTDEFPHLPADYAVMTPSSDDLRRDPRVAALTAAIHSLHHHITIANGQPSPDFDGELAAAILAAVPDWTLVPADELEGKRDEIATLRAALADEKERNGLYLATLDNMNATIARLRAALGTARLELMQDVDPDAIVAGIDCALTP